MDLRKVQEQLDIFWTDFGYPDSFNNSPLPHRHFNHALSHATKALGGLAALSDALDHERMQKHGHQDLEARIFSDNAGKWLADLVICASRMAQQRHLNIAEEVEKRVEILTQRWKVERENT